MKMRIIFILLLSLLMFSVIQPMTPLSNSTVSMAKCYKKSTIMKKYKKIIENEPYKAVKKDLGSKGKVYQEWSDGNKNINWTFDLYNGSTFSINIYFYCVKYKGNKNLFVGDKSYVINSF